MSVREDVVWLLLGLAFLTLSFFVHDDVWRMLTLGPAFVAGAAFWGNSDFARLDERLRRKEGLGAEDQVKSTLERMSLHTQSSPSLAKRLHFVVLRMSAIWLLVAALGSLSGMFFASWSSYPPDHFPAQPGCYKESGHLLRPVECHGFPGTGPATVLMNFPLVLAAPPLAFSKMTSVIPRTAAAITMLVVWVPTIYGAICIIRSGLSRRRGSGQ